MYCLPPGSLTFWLLLNRQTCIVFLSIYTNNKTTVVNLLIYNGTTSGCSVLTVEVNRVSACAKSNNRFYLFNLVWIMLESK